LRVMLPHCGAMEAITKLDLLSLQLRSRQGTSRHHSDFTNEDLRRSHLMVDEFCHCVFLWIVAQADKIDLILGNLLEAFDHPRLLVTFVVGRKAFFISFTMVLVFESVQETVHILRDGENRRRLPIGSDVEAVQLHGSQAFRHQCSQWVWLTNKSTAVMAGLRNLKFDPFARHLYVQRASPAACPVLSRTTTNPLRIAGESMKSGLLPN
jgi:hypothetical protein